MPAEISISGLITRAHSALYKDILLRSVRTNKEASDGHQDRGTGT